MVIVILLFCCFGVVLPGPEDRLATRELSSPVLKEDNSDDKSTLFGNDHG